MVNSKGYFPYYKAEEAVAGETKPTVGGKWIRTDLITSTELNILSSAALKSMADTLNQTALAPFKCSVLPYKGDFLAIYAPEDDYRNYREIYCDSSGRPYVAQAKPDNAAVNQSNNYYTEVNQNNQSNNNVVIDQGTTENNTLIDVDSNSVWFPDGSFNFINQLLYDESTKTYYVDSHDSYTWNETTNNYVTNNYNSFYQYHINYTSITYIGTTAEYDETYELYYQLPDGRSSADLTAEDLEQLSLVFSDVTNYRRSADDVSQRALYHFDGDTQDSSYWSYCSDFKWSAGASLTYMDEGTFGGSLYLDETAHDFTLTLPNNDASGDFTLQFRYYQSYTAAPKTDSTLSLGGVTVLKWDGAKYYTGTGTAICATSIGTWNEICLMSVSGTLYYYINGVYYTSAAYSFGKANTVRFQFGSQQQTYKKLDELRFTRGAVYEPGQNYTCSAVPFDSNLALVLPDGEYPIADEVMSVVPGENNLLDGHGLSDWTDSSVMDELMITSGYSAASKVQYDPSHTSVSVGNGFVTVSNDTADAFSNGLGTHSQGAGLFVPVYSSYHKPYISYPVNSVSSFFSMDASTTYCLSVVLADGTSSFCVFATPSSSAESWVMSSFSLSRSSVNSVVSFSTFVFSYGYADYLNESVVTCVGGIYLKVNSGKTADIVYMELVQGNKPSFSLDWHSAVYSSGQLEESPVLAVRSNLDVTTYQIGGVRPSYPSRGQVWALVENSRITSLQQYNGSAWVPVDGRIWTGERWIPYGSFDVFTLQDCYDIVDSSGDDFEYIYTESGFWAWWQKSWRTFAGKMDNWFALLLSALGVSDPGSGPGTGTGSGGSFWDRIFNAIADGLASVIELLFDLIKIVLEQVLDLVNDLLSFFFDMLTDMVISGVGKFFSVFTDGSLFGFFQQEQENEDGTVTTVVALPDDIAGVFGFFSAVILLLPEELRAILIFGVAVMILLSVFKLVKA